MSQHLSETPIDDVLSVVERLTASHQSSFTIEVDGEKETVTLKHEPLLKQLRGAVISTIGARPGG